MNHEAITLKLRDDLLAGKLVPWKTEEAAREEGISEPENIRIGINARRSFLEQKSGHTLKHITISEKPYLLEYRCSEDNTRWWLAANDSYRQCSLCGNNLEPIDQQLRYKPLVNNYIGGIEDYFSYAGEVSVSGDVNKTFQNILIWGTGIGHLGINAGCFQLNQYGPIEVVVSEWAYAARNLSFVFDSEAEREQAKNLIQAHLHTIIPEITQAQIAEWKGEISDVDFLYKQHHNDRILHCCFYSRFKEHRGHGQTSHAVGMAKNIIDDLFIENGIKCRVSVVGMGRDGDLKPSPRNRRGRYVSAQQSIPISAYEQRIGRPIEDFRSYIELDRQAVVEEVGWPAYTGMGGEIIPAFYRTMKNNPRPFLVSSFQKVYARTDGDYLVFGVEIPNVEVGITSSPEGIIPPASREALKIAGISNAREFAAALAAITLAGEYNFATLHIREKMYTGR